MRCFAALAVLLLFVAPAQAEPTRPRLERVLVKVEPGSVPAVVNSKTIFLNRCKGGCKVYAGYTDSRTNKSGIGQGTLSAYPHGDTSWNSLVSCMKSVMSRFNVNVTDVDPGANVDHFEVMIAGSPGQLGLSSGIGGIAEYSCSSPGVCSTYLPNALVFAFASVYGNEPLEICATAAQELAHTWTLDHVTDASDPMTYRTYSGMRQFKDGVYCGSDCINGQSPFGLPCNSSGQHTCMSTGGATQNDVQILTALFGPAGAKSPTLTVSNPTNGSAQQPGFAINAECTSTDGIQEVTMSLDGVPKATLTAPPFTFMAPATLSEGPHKVTVLCATRLQAISTITVDVFIGQGCPCTKAGYICFDGACIAGPDAAGGLGAACNGSADCVAGSCASDGTTMACVIPCDVEAQNCPDGFGCIEAGTSGVCWYGAADGGGCCDTTPSGGAPGALLLALGISATLITRRKRR
jgi:hypothetical protein